MKLFLSITLAVLLSHPAMAEHPDDKAGKRGGYHVYASRVGDEYRDGGEWLYDVCWLEYDGNRLVSVPLICECERDHRPEYVDKDFQKLLFGNAAVKVLTYDGGTFDPSESAIWNTQAQGLFKGNADQSLINADHATGQGVYASRLRPDVSM